MQLTILYNWLNNEKKDYSINTKKKTVHIKVKVRKALICIFTTNVGHDIAILTWK